MIGEILSKPFAMLQIKQPQSPGYKELTDQKNVCADVERQQRVDDSGGTQLPLSMKLHRARDIPSLPNKSAGHAPLDAPSPPTFKTPLPKPQPKGGSEASKKSWWHQDKGSPSTVIEPHGGKGARSRRAAESEEPEIHDKPGYSGSELAVDYVARTPKHSDQGRASFPSLAAGSGIEETSQKERDGELLFFIYAG